MALRDLIEQLAFGRSAPKMSSCIGIYVSSRTVFLAEARIVAGKPAIDHLVKIPIPTNAPKDTRMTGIMSADVLADEKVVDLLRQALRQGRWRSKHAVITLSHHFGLLRYFTMPQIEAKYWATAIPAEAKKYVPIPFDDLISDFQVRSLGPGPDNKVRQGALIGVSQRKNVENLKALAAKLGLELAGLELSPCSVERLFDLIHPASGKPYAHVQFDGGEARILISEKGIPTFVREVLLGADAKVEDRRKMDLAGCIEFAGKQLGVAKPSVVRISGTGSDIPAWKDAFTQEAGVAAAVEDIPKALGLRGCEWGGYAAIGAAFRHQVPTILTLDLASSSKTDDVDRKVARAAFGIGGAVTAVFLAMGLANHALARVSAGELRRLNRSGATLPAFQGKKVDQIQQMIADMQRRADALRSLAVPKSRLSALLAQVSKNVPDQVWLSGVSYDFPIDEAINMLGSSRHSLSLSGAVSGANEVNEQDISIQFRDNLNKDEGFHKVFSTIEWTAQANPTADASALAQQARTKFTIRCNTEKPRG